MGTIYPHAGSATGDVVESFGVATSARVTVSGSSRTIDRTATLADGTPYWLTLGSGAIEDLAGNDYAGMRPCDACLPCT